MSAHCTDAASYEHFFLQPEGQRNFGPAAANRYPATVGRALMLMLGHAHFGKLVFVDIGANKGIYSAGLFDATCVTKMRRWDNAILGRHSELSKMVGNDGFEHSKKHDLVTEKECPTIHAIEADPRICGMLKHVPQVHGFPVGHYKIHNVAMYSTNGVMDFHLTGGALGSEHGTLANMGSRRGETTRLRTLTYDSFANEQGIAQAAWVKIDAEGVDPYILHGMTSSLRAKTVLGLQFEFSNLWELANATHTLRHAVDFLDGLGYHTYYAGRTLLMPLWGSHWRPSFGKPARWSDMVALQAGTVFEAFFLRQFRAGPPCRV